MIVTREHWLKYGFGPATPARAANAPTPALLVTSTGTPASGTGNVSSPPAATHVDLSQKGQEVVESASRRAYDIQANLDIQTPRPVIENYYSAERNLATMKITRSAEEVSAAYAQIYGDPVDLVLDRAFKWIAGDIRSVDAQEKMRSVYDSQEVSVKARKYTGGSRADDLRRIADLRASNEEGIADARRNLRDTLRMTHDQNEKLGLAEYAQEVFLKRGAVENGRPIDLAALYEEYGIS